MFLVVQGLNRKMLDSWRDINAKKTLLLFLSILNKESIISIQVGGDAKH